MQEPNVVAIRFLLPPDAIAARLSRTELRESRGDATAWAELCRVPVHAHARRSSAAPFFFLGHHRAHAAAVASGCRAPAHVHTEHYPSRGPKSAAFASPSPVSTTAVAGRREPGSRSLHVSELIKMTGSPRALSDVYTEANKSTSLVLSVDRNTHTHLRKTKAYKLITLFK